MKISHGTRINSIEESNGYGYATVNMLDSLARLGYEVKANDPTADVEVWFDQPQHWKFSKGVYKIGYHPWESTRLKPGWAEIMNECDEIWTPSPLIAEWYTKHAGIKVPVFVYEHGVDPVWKPVDRKVEDKMRFLHVGGEAARKGSREVMRAFRMAFVKNTDVELDLKIISDGWNIGGFNRINIINGKMSFTELIKLFHDSHAYVYPSWGEGFGLTPLQAMATGMPTVTVPEWAPYAHHLDPRLLVGSKLAKSPWPALHPGLMLEPSLDDLIDRYRFVYNNYDSVQKFAHDQVPAVTEEYDWDSITKKVFGDLEHRLENS